MSAVPPFDPAKVRFLCTFCHEAIEGEVCALIVVRHWNGPPEQQKFQQFFSHKLCVENTTGEKLEVE